MSKSLRIIYLLNFFGLITLLIINFLADILPINDITAVEIFEKNNQLFYPAAFTLFIWSIIYIGLTAFILYQFRAISSTRISGEPTGFISAQLGFTFLIMCIANAAWIIALHYEQLILSTLFITLLLLSLTDINRRIFKLSKTQQNLPKYFNWFVKAPFGLFLGWVCISLTANIALYLSSIQWGGFGLTENVWTGIMICLNCFFALWLLAKMKLYSATLAIAWGIFGIQFKHADFNQFLTIQVAGVLSLALIGMGIAKSLGRRKLNFKK